MGLQAQIGIRDDEDTPFSEEELKYWQDLAQEKSATFYISEDRRRVMVMAYDCQSITQTAPLFKLVMLEGKK